MSPSPFDAWQLRPLSPEELQNLGAGQAPRLDQLRQLVRYSLLAPTSHNTVPQRYALDAERATIRIQLDAQHVLPASDDTGREALISVGCAIENLVQAAAAHGLRATWQAAQPLDWRDVGPGSGRTELGCVALTPAPLPSPDDRARTLTALLERRVIRAEYDPGRVLSDEVISELEGAVLGMTDVRLRVFQTPRDRFSWGKLDEMAMKHKLEEQPFREELGHWLLPNDADQVRGMRGREFGLDDRRTLELSAQLRGERDMPADQLAFMARAGRNGLTSSSALGVLTCEVDSAAGPMAVGRAYQRCALIAWRHRVAHAVHTAVCKVAHARAMAQATLLQGESPVVVFRLGTPLHAADWQRPHSSRPLLDEVIVPAPSSTAARSASAA
jgi:hypothetical protein